MGEQNEKSATAFKRTISKKKKDVLSLIDNYFNLNNCVSTKNARTKLDMVTLFYSLSSAGALKAPEDSVLGRSFVNFLLIRPISECTHDCSAKKSEQMESNQ